MSAIAQTLTIAVLVDTDNDSTTGCQVTAPGNTVFGVEQLVQAIVDGTALIVTEVSVAT